MEARDTVMSETQRGNIFFHGMGTLEEVCRVQAEISFKAGMREVIRWMKEEQGIYYTHELYNDIEKQVKEWGL